MSSLLFLHNFLEAIRSWLLHITGRSLANRCLISEFTDDVLTIFLMTPFLPSKLLKLLLRLLLLGF